MRLRLNQALTSLLIAASFGTAVMGCGSEKAPKAPALASSDDEGEEDEDEDEDKVSDSKLKAKADLATKPVLGAINQPCQTATGPATPSIASTASTTANCSTATPAVSTPTQATATNIGSGLTTSTGATSQPWTTTPSASTTDDTNKKSGRLSGLCSFPFLPDFIKQTVCSGTI
ncbi:MAG: hypothetical protein RL011_320 [Pseudomonadota bacterium]